MLQKFKDHIHSTFSLLEGKKLLLAVSGGIDSMVLLDLCQALSMDIAVAHCNFGLRGADSEADEAFVKERCAVLGIPIHTQKFDTKAYAEEAKLSVQVAARNLRYDWFESLLKEHGYHFLFTAHHLDDSLETFLINFSRGTGLEGLTGIPQQNDKTIRPLLAFSRDEIVAYAQSQQLEWREDSSNASDKYQRNKLRHDVIPVLKEGNPALLHSFEMTLSHLQQAQSMVEDASRIVYRKVVTDSDWQKKMNLPELMQLPNYTAYLYQWLRPLGFTDWEAIAGLVAAQSGKQIHSQSHTVLKDRNDLIVFRKQQETGEECFFIEKGVTEVKFPLKLTLSTVADISVLTTNTIFVDEEKLSYPLRIRKWEEGDAFYPYGMEGKKKLSKFFKDEKLSLLDKSGVWLLCSGNQIVWVVGKRADDRYKITSETTKILQIQLQE